MENKFKSAAQKLVRLVQTYPKWAGNEAKNHFADSFRKEAWDGEAWKPRAKADTNPKRRNLLVKTGRLKRSIRIERTGPGFVQVSTDVPYAEIHNEGGTINATVNVRAHRRKIVSRNVGKGRKKTASGVAFVKAHSRVVNISMPRRQFMGNSQQLIHALDAGLRRDFEAILNEFNIIQTLK